MTTFHCPIVSWIVETWPFSLPSKRKMMSLEFVSFLRQAQRILSHLHYQETWVTTNTYISEWERETSTNRFEGALGRGEKKSLGPGGTSFDFLHRMRTRERGQSAREEVFFSSHSAAYIETVPTRKDTEVDLFFSREAKRSACGCERENDRGSVDRSSNVELRRRCTLRETRKKGKIVSWTRRKNGFAVSREREKVFLLSDLLPFFLLLQLLSFFCSGQPGSAVSLSADFEKKSLFFIKGFEGTFPLSKMRNNPRSADPSFFNLPLPCHV